MATYAYVHDIRVHIGRNPRSQHGEVRKSLSSLTINAPLIVKDEVDKVFELILFRNKTKNLCGLRLIVIWDYARPALEGPLDRWVHDYYSNRIVII